jgi:membrane-bound metal-dependent hydrolase YbcI (DUF457 family)
MTPISHSAIGMLNWQWFSEKKNLKTLAVFVLLANLPDIDFALFLLLGKKGLEMHQYYTHNVFFIGLTALLLWPWFKEKKERIGLLLTAYSHLLLDFLTIDARFPLGFKMFYPLSHQFFNFGIFPNLQKDNLVDLFSLHNLWTVCFETLVFLLPVLWVCRKTLSRYLKQNEQWET